MWMILRLKGIFLSWPTPVINFASVGANIASNFIWFYKIRVVVKCFFGLKVMANYLISIFLLIENP